MEIDSSLEPRIEGHFNCTEALALVKSPDIKFVFIMPTNNEKCISRNIYHLIQRKGSNSFKLIIQESLDIDILDGAVKFEPKLKKILLKRSDFSKKYFLGNIVRTIINCPCVYISYGNDPNETKDIIGEISSAFKAVLPYVDIKYDKVNKYKENINGFIDDLVNGGFIIILINEKYLKSEYCMFEFVNMVKASKNNEELKLRICPIILNSSYYNINDYIEIEEYWVAERNRLNDKSAGIMNSKIHEKIELIDEIIKILPNFHSIITSLYNLPINSFQEEKYLSLLWHINEQLESDGYMSFYNEEAEMKEVLNSNA